MNRILDFCFGENETIGVEEFKDIAYRKTSDLVLSVLSLIRQRVPCSENFYRLQNQHEATVENAPKLLAKPLMSFLKSVNIFGGN
jgi:hypothetical protein